jgi:cellulose biosynthesis protein BcsQ
MITTCWSVKGGSGATVVASGLAVLAARDTAHTRLGRATAKKGTGRRVVVVDFAGDIGAVLGVDEETKETQLGFFDWLLADTSVPTGALARVIGTIRHNIEFLPKGREACAEGGMQQTVRLGDGLAWLNNQFDEVIVDVGSAPPHVVAACIEAADRSVLVVRPCYLSLRLAVKSTFAAHAAVVVSTDGRSIDAHDVAAVLGVPMTLAIPFDPDIARLVDSGLFGHRLPRSIERLKQVTA